MDSEILNRLMVKITNELRDFIPRNVFHPLGMGIKFNGRLLSEEEARGCLASGFAEKLFYVPPKNKFLTDRQYIASELLMYLGRFVSIEATDPQRPDVMVNLLESFRRYRGYLTEQEAQPFISLLKSDPEKSELQVTESDTTKTTSVRGIDKRKVMLAFQGIKWDSSHWGKNLGNPPKWLIECRIEKGVRGNNQIPSKWNPIEIAVALLDKGITEEELNRVFKKPTLKDWADEWREKTYS